MLLLLFDAHWGHPLGVPERIGEVEITQDRDRYGEADLVVFHVPEWKADRLRARRPWSWQLTPAKRPGQLWVAASLECEDHYPIQADVRFIEHFDITMTYRLDSDIPTTYAIPFGPASAMVEALRRPPAAKTEAALMAAFISSAVDRSDRRAYLYELSQYMAIGSYGRFMNNRSLGADAGRATKLDTIARYKFTAAFENARARDYVTEKFFDPLWAGSVPVYFGAPNVAAFAPGDHCYIDAARFADPRDLAAYLAWLDRTPAEYERFFAWKREPLNQGFTTLITAEETHPLERLCRLARRRLGDIGSVAAGSLREGER